MLKKVLISIVLLLLVFAMLLNVDALSLGDISAECAELICTDSLDVIFSKDSNRTLSMASTTKIMTSLIALELNTPYLEVTVDESAASTEGSSSGLSAGDRLYLIDLVYCMLLESGNDAANATAYAVAGSEEDFAVLMNQRAKKIGMKNTSFVTPSGLDDENHYTTAHDMALLTAEALKNSEFIKICSTASYKVHFLDSDKTVTLGNHNRLLYSYDGCIGVKTGFTKKSGRCLVSAAQRAGVTLAAVSLNAPNDWEDHTEMLDYGFSMYAAETFKIDVTPYEVRVTGGAYPTVKIKSEEAAVSYRKDDAKPQITYEIFTDKFIYAPVVVGQKLGYAEIYADGILYKTVPLTAADNNVAVFSRNSILKFKDSRS